jgi:hypothetical protein
LFQSPTRFKKGIIKRSISIGDDDLMDKAYIDLDEVRRQQREEVI